MRIIRVLRGAIYEIAYCIADLAEKVTDLTSETESKPLPSCSTCGQEVSR